MKITLLIVLIFLILSFQVQTKKKEQWKSRNVYQIITDRFALGDGSKPPCDIAANVYCGGNFAGVTRNLEYIKDMGFDAIWISPIPKNYPGKYYGYAAMDIYQLNDHFGTEEEFVEMLKAMRDNNMWLMLDVVANHMGNENEDYSQNVPFNNPDNYHKWCDITDQCFATHDMPCIQNCRLANLADINQENEWVANTLYDWIHDLVNKYQIEGLRIDTVPEVPSWFWSKFNDAANVYTVGEVFDGDMGYSAQYIGPLDSVLNYPFFFRMKDIWIYEKSMYGIRDFYNDWLQHINYEDLQYMGLFTDNHDNARFLSDVVCTGHNGRSFEDCVVLYKSLFVMTLTSVGIPMTYYGSEQYFNGGNDPWDREPMWNNFDPSSELYQYIKVINNARKQTELYDSQQVEAYVTDDFYAFFRGEALVCLTNRIHGTVNHYVTYTPFQDGQVVCNIFYPDSDCFTVKGGVNVFLNNGESKIYVPKKSAKQSKFLE